MEAHQELRESTFQFVCKIVLQNIDKLNFDLMPDREKERLLRIVNGKEKIGPEDLTSEVGEMIKKYLGR